MPRLQIFLSVVTTCSLSGRYPHFGGTCFRLQGRPSRREHYEIFIFFSQSYRASCGPGSVVGIATVYGLDGPRVESRWGRDFLHLSRPALGFAQPFVQWVPGLSWG